MILKQFFLLFICLSIKQANSQTNFDNITICTINNTLAMVKAGGDQIFLDKGRLVRFVTKDSSFSYNTADREICVFDTGYHSKLYIRLVNREVWMRTSDTAFRVSSPSSIDSAIPSDADTSLAIRFPYFEPLFKFRDGAVSRIDIILPGSALIIVIDHFKALSAWQFWMESDRYNDKISYTESFLQPRSLIITHELTGVGVYLNADRRDGIFNIVFAEQEAAPGKFVIHSRYAAKFNKQGKLKKRTVKGFKIEECVTR